MEETILIRGSANLPVLHQSEQNGSPADQIKNLFSWPTIIVDVINHSSTNFQSRAYPACGNFSLGQHKKNSISLSAVNGEIKYHTVTRSDTDDGAQIVWELWQRNMFYFSAERFAIGESAHSHADRLTPDAQNLPAVLHTLIGSRGTMFQKLVSHLRDIFPTVGNLSVRPNPNNNQLEIRVWPTEEMNAVELSFPLNASGTGVAQAIAILTAIMTINDSVIIIDEINSFLHPSAVKSLIRVIKTHYGSHQYIISTHAPEVISFCDPDTIHIVKRTGYESSIEPLKLDDVDAFRNVAEHLGVSMADVFAAERIIWVEGPTEELCFPLIYQHSGSSELRGIIFTAVSATGDFMTGRRSRALVYDVYKRLSSATTPLRVSVVFSFDTEKLSPEQCAEMRRESGGLVHFLPRRHLECYLVDPEAIAAFIAEKDVDGSTSVSGEIIRKKILELGPQKEFNNRKWRGDIADPNWLGALDAARFINRVCSETSECKVTFSKKADSLFLLKYIFLKKPDQLSPLVKYVKELVDQVRKNDV
ncbi:ATP-dependent nuclease [Mesorhizobium helmanticense]|uniref:ATP-dependent nuclease n=1 Tax=Mesorhizobium helmanticense TaxID=1776423 RepID=UPI001FE1ED4E|nr:AAA family ATPase [Mesorhizobium helmanticense]